MHGSTDASHERQRKVSSRGRVLHVASAVYLLAEELEVLGALGVNMQQNSYFPLGFPSSAVVVLYLTNFLVDALIFCNKCAVRCHEDKIKRHCSNILWLLFSPLLPWLCRAGSG